MNRTFPSLLALADSLPRSSTSLTHRIPLHRTLATLSDLPTPPTDPTTSSKSRTLPHAVRTRRHQFPHLQKEFTPAQEVKFQTLRAEGLLPGDEVQARGTFLAEQEGWRSRVRGFRQVKNMPSDAEDSLEIDQSLEDFTSPGQLHPFSSPLSTPPSTSLVAQRIYLPNIQIRLMRNHTPPGEPYDPYVATFRIPPSMTKQDLRSYLLAVYGLHVTFMRTANYVAPVGRGAGMQKVKVGGSKKNYKRAIVGLYEPFHYPDDLTELDAVISHPIPTSLTHPDLSPAELDSFKEEVEVRRVKAEEGKKAREKWLDETFLVKARERGRKRALMKMAKGWRWRSVTHDNRGNTIQAIMQKRAVKEAAIAKEVEKNMREVYE